MKKSLSSRKMEVLAHADFYAEHPDALPDHALKHTRRKHDEAAAWFRETYLAPDADAIRAFYAVLDAAFNLGVRATLTPETEKFYSEEAQSKRGKRSQEKQAENRVWLQPAEKLMQEKRRRDPSLSQSALALAVLPELTRVVGKKAPKSSKTLVKYIRKLERSGALPRRLPPTAQAKKFKPRRKA